MLRAVALVLAVLFSIALPALSIAQVEESQAPATVIPLTPELASSGEALTSLRGAWMHAEPFQHAAANVVDGVGGMDVDILAAIAHAAHTEVRLEKLSWTQQQEELLSGQLDLAFGAFQPESSDARFYYSMPYRQSRIALFVRAGDEARYDLSDVTALLEQNKTFRLGLIAGRSFQDQRLTAAFDSAAREGRVVVVGNIEESLRKLADGHIDGFIADRLGTAATAIKLGLMPSLRETILPGSWGVHIIFSKATVSPETVSRFNAAIGTLEKKGTLQKIVHKNIFSVIMSYVFNSVFFQSLEVIGTIAFAISGVLIAYRERFSLIGALVLSALPAVGGGALRDVLMDRNPIGVLANPLYLYLVALTVVCGLAVIRLGQMFQRRGWGFAPGTRVPDLLNFKNIHELSDAVGLGAFTVSGASVAVLVGADPLWLWAPISAVLTAAGGGILRDIVRQAGHVSTLKSEFYAEVPLIWGLLFGLFLLTRPALLVPEEIVAAIVVTLVGATLSRVAAVWYGLRGIRFGW